LARQFGARRKSKEAVKALERRIARRPDRRRRAAGQHRKEWYFPMMDAFMRRLIDPTLTRLGQRVAKLGVSANQITLVGFALGLAALPLLASGQTLWGLGLILLNRLFDGLDGAVARQVGKSDFGGYLDVVLDFIFYSGVVVGFALQDPANLYAALFLIWSFSGTGSSFLAYAIIAAKRGLTTEIRGSKSLYYLGGLTEGSETIALFVFISLAPGSFVPAAYLFGALCWITTLSRILAAHRAFNDPAPLAAPGRPGGPDDHG
jgi:phosphatidylglycerophosphate synthase